MEKDASVLTGTRLVVETLTQWIGDAERQIDQIQRRVLNGEAIPHDQKVSSLFERHTEWICKGKSGVPVELGVRVCVLEDQHQFILHHRVMWKETNDKVAVAMVSQAQERYPDLRQFSFNKGFHTPSNQAELKTMLEHVVLPKKGRRSQSDQAREGDEVSNKRGVNIPRWNRASTIWNHGAWTGAIRTDVTVLNGTWPWRSWRATSTASG